MTDTSKPNDTNPTLSETAYQDDVESDDRAKVMCSIIFDRLRKQDVVRVRITDPQMRKADDLQITTESRVNAYLLRWSEWPDKLELDDLTSERTGEAAVMKQLADSWQRLTQEHHLPVFVHLVTNDQPSAKKLAGADRNDFHLAKFLASEWKKNRQDDPVWIDFWTALRTASGLSESDFENFSRQCRFDCSYSKPEFDEDQDGNQPYHWVEHIFDVLFEHEDHTLPIELNHAELVQIIGWRGEQSNVIKPKTIALEVRDEPTLNAEHDDYSGSDCETDEMPSLASMRSSGAAAGWLAAADDSGSEVAGWLKTGAETAPLPTTSKDLRNQGQVAEESERDERKPLSSFLGNKQGKEKKGWRALAEGERHQTGSTRRFSDTMGERVDDVEKQRTTGKLRQMLGSRVAEPTVEFPEESDDETWSNAPRQEMPSKERSDPVGDHGGSANDEQNQIAGRGDDQDSTQDIDPDALRRSNKRIERAQSALSEGTVYSDDPLDPSDPQVEFEGRETITGDPPIWSNEDVIEHHVANEKTSANDEEANEDTDQFAKISRLGRMQEGHSYSDEAAARDAFDWYLNNANELFEANRFEDAALEYNRALELLENLPGPNYECEFLILQNLGDIYMFLDQPEQAVDLYERTKQQHFNAKIPAAKYIAALIKLGTLHEDNNCFSDAEREYRKAIEIAAEFLPQDDPILVRLNDACLNLARNRSTLMSRFSSKEVERIREMAKQEVDVAIIYRKKKGTETDTEKLDIWRGGQSDPEEELPEPPSPKRLWLAASVGVLIIFVFAYAMLVPHSGTRGALAPDGRNVSGIYSSADDQKTIELSPGGSASYNHNGTTEKASYTFIGNSIQDLLPLIPGHLRSAFTFFRAADDSIVDNDGTYFYTHAAPETLLVKRMWKYAELAQEYRAAKSFYPESDDVWAISKDKLTFTNPITRSRDQATIFSTTGESTDTPMRKSMAAGEMWENQPRGGPGRIICNVYNGRMFFIRAFDRNGNLLTSADKGKCFYIECADGIDVTKDKLKELHNKALLGTNSPEVNPVAPAPPQKSDKKLRFVFAASPDMEAQLHTLLRAVPGALFALVLITGANWRFRVNKKIAGPLSLTAFIMTVTLLLAWYVVGILDIAH
jgi:tetratricopeptide (TPR) repeat protein